MKKVKIRISEQSRCIISLAEAKNVNEMLEELKCNGAETAIPEYLDIVMGCICDRGGDWRFYDLQAEICKNSRIYCYYTDRSEHFDVWIEFKAFDRYNGFYIVGVNLTDIYSITSENHEAIRKYMYIRHYKEVE